MTAFPYKKILLLAAALLAVLFAHIAWLTAWPLGKQAVYVLTDTTAAACLLCASYQHPRGARLFWLLLFLGSCAFLVGDAILLYKYVMQSDIILYRGLEELFFLLFMFCCAAALWYKLVHKHDRWNRVFILLDLLITMTVAATLDYYIIIQHILRQVQTSYLSLAVQLAYPILDLLLLFLAIALFLQSTSFSSRLVLYILLVSVFMLVMTDFTYDYWYLFRQQKTANELDVLYQVVLLLTAAAGVLSKQGAGLALPQLISEGTERNIRAAVPYIGSVLLGLFTLARPEDNHILVVGLCLTFSLVLIRHTLTERENTGLLRQLRQTALSLEQRIQERTSDLLEQTEALLQSEERFKSLYQYHPDPIYTLDLSGNLIQTNRAGTQLLGYDDVNFLGKPYADFVAPEDIPIARELFNKVLQGISSTAEVRASHRSGMLYQLSVTAVPIITKGALSGIYFMVKDITAVKEQQVRINYLAYHDPLTNLYNRSYFTMLLNEAIARRKPFALLFIDLDRFKTINDTLGHASGDSVLIHTAKQLRRCLPEQALTARFGGDEFTVILPDCATCTIAAEAAKRILAELQLPIRLEAHTVQVTPSVGIALYPEAGYDAGTLLRHADIAMYTVKSKGKNNFAVYDRNMSSQLRRRLRIEQDLPEALRRRNLFLVYQPQIDVSAQRIIGWEALVRWEHPLYGWLSPTEFISIAEEAGLMPRLSEYVLQEACMQMKEWRKLGYTSWHIAVNLSANEFREPNFVEMVTNALEKSGLEPPYLELELTERIAMENEEETLHKLRRLKELGVQLSIDDFGTGYSSLSYLPLYPIDTLKIARELVSMAAQSEEGIAIVSAILSLARALHLSVVAEGVETKQQVDLLLTQGCRHIQGYYFSKPLPPDACIPFAQSFRLS